MDITLCLRSKLGVAYQVPSDSMQVVVAIEVFLEIEWLVPRKNNLKALIVGAIDFVAGNGKS